MNISRLFSLCAVLGATLIVSACSSTNDSGRPQGDLYKPNPKSYSWTGFGKPSPYGGSVHPTRVQIGKPYTIKGKRYYPKHQPNYDEVGLASWYGPGFHGRKTANGEKYDQNAMTAAHKTLPLPSWVKVTRIDNGKSIIVRVNDRGPFAKGRIIDLSAAAAKKLGTQKSGLKKVRVQYLSKMTKEYVNDLGLKTPKGYPKATGTPSRAYAAKGKTTTKATRPKIARKIAKPVEKKIVSSPVQVAQASLASQPKASTVKLSYQGEEVVNTQKYIAPQATPRARANYHVQSAMFSNLDMAARHANVVGSLARAQVQQASYYGRPAYKVVLGPVREAYNAENLLGKVKDLGFDDARILVD